MSQYINVVKQLGAEFDIPVLDIQEVFDVAVVEKPAMYWAPDQIHPVSDGHWLIAEHVFKFLKK